MVKCYVIKRVGYNEYIGRDEEVGVYTNTDDILEAIGFINEELAEKVLFVIEDTPYENELENLAFEIIKIYRK